MKVLRFLKVVFINIVTFLVLLFLVNWATGFFLKSTQATRDQLPNYENDRAHAKNVFRDYNSVQHQYEPFVGWRTLPYTGETTTINAAGVRIHTPPQSSTIEKTVRFFGGSTMWGEGSDDQHTIPALFNEHFPQFEVHNHGQLAYNTRQEVDALITTYSRKLKADIVIFYDGVNDAAFLCPTEITDLPAHRLVPMFREKVYAKKSYYIKEAFFKGFLDNITRLINRYASNYEKVSPYNCISDPDKAKQIADMFVSNWELAHEIVTNRGGKFIAILQPAAFIGKPKTDYLPLDEDLKTNFSEVYKEIKLRLAEKKYDWVYDLSDKFDRDEHIYIDFCHVSPNGNKIIADALADIVKQQQW